MIETRNIYVQLLELCQKQLATGQWSVGDRFPSERELAQTHGISRTTANKVISKLASEGWLELRKGIGTFVAARPGLFTSLERMESFTEFAQAQGFVPSTGVMEFVRLERAPEPVGSILGMQREEPAFFLRRHRRANDETVIVEHRYLSARLYPDLRGEDLEGSFYALSEERFGLKAVSQRLELSATNPPAEVRDQWQVPALKLSGVGEDLTRKVLWYQELYYHGGRFRLHHASTGNSPSPSVSLHFQRR
jgi:DNA-binding GntR family transcriptional regulator